MSATDSCLNLPDCPGANNTNKSQHYWRPYWVNLGSADFDSCDYRICLGRGSHSHWIINLSTKHESSIQNLSEKSKINQIGAVTAKLEPIYHPSVIVTIRVIYAGNRQNHQYCIRYFPITESCCWSDSSNRSKSAPKLLDSETQLSKNLGPGGCDGRAPTIDKIPGIVTAAHRLIETLKICMFIVVVVNMQCDTSTTLEGAFELDIFNRRLRPRENPDPTVKPRRMLTAQTPNHYRYRR